jgi:hypothetical protein
MRRRTSRSVPPRLEPLEDRRVLSGLFTAQQANSYDDAWQAAWIAHSDSIYTTAGKTSGSVLEIGDSITHSNPYSQWPRYGAGQTPADQATIAWAHATSWNTGSNTDTTNKNGWYLAAADTSSIRGMTASGGMSTAEFLSGSGNGGATMPVETNPQTAQAIVSNGVAYPGNLQVNTVAAAFSDAQFAVLMLGTNDAAAGVSTSTFTANLTSIVNVLEGQKFVVILSTLPPSVAYNNTVIAYNTAIQNYAQSHGLPLIDFYAEILARAPGTLWQNTLISSDGIHPSAAGAGYNSASDPYTPGGDPATQTTGDACLNVGYLLRSWLTIQKLEEVEQYVLNTTTSADTQPPTVPSNLAATAVSGSQINLSWTASTDNVGVTGYRVERQDPGSSTFTQVATVTGAAYSDTGLTAGRTYSYRVRATDAAGNLSPYSNVASATTNQRRWH